MLRLCVLSTCLVLWLTALVAPAGEPPTGTARSGVLPIETDQIQLPQAIEFKPRTAEILPDSHPLLASVAATLETHLEISLLEIGAHTDSQGSGAFNKAQSQQRADAVRLHLIHQGIPAARLKAVGYGEERPIADNRTAAGRATNRRVELRILQRCPEGQVFLGDGCKAR